MALAAALVAAFDADNVAHTLGLAVANGLAANHDARIRAVATKHPKALPAIRQDAGDTECVGRLAVVAEDLAAPRAPCTLFLHTCTSTVASKQHQNSNRCTV